MDVRAASRCSRAPALAADADAAADAAWSTYAPTQTNAQGAFLWVDGAGVDVRARERASAHHRRVPRGRRSRAAALTARDPAGG